MLPYPDKEDIDFQEIEHATNMGRSRAPPELGLPPMNPCNQQAGEELEFLATLPTVAFRIPAAAGDTLADRHADTATVPPAGLTLDLMQELGGPDKSRYLLDDYPRGEGSITSQSSGSGQSQYESLSEGSSVVDSEGECTICT